MSYVITKKELLKRINPHLLNFNKFDAEEYEIKTYNSEELFFNIGRFDLIPKYVYIHYKLNGYKTNFHKELYSEHIKAFSGNTFKEGDGKKNNLNAFLEQFDTLIADFQKNGFNSDLSIIPINNELRIVDGAHRLAASYYFKQNVNIFLYNYNLSYNYKFFFSRGLKKNYSDFVAFKYCELNTNSRIVNLFPCSNIADAEIEDILTKHGAIHYKKEIKLNIQAQNYVVKEMYKDEHWIGNEQNNYAGVIKRARISFENKNILKVYVYVPFSHEDAVAAKTEIRKIINKGNYPVHINDTHKETIRLSQTYFNENTLHFINQKKNIKFEKFEKLFNEYKSWIKENELNSDDFCIDASSVLSVYGIREGMDLDFLYSKKNDIKTEIQLVDCHNEHVHFYNLEIDDIIYNPNNHFYFEEVKFVSISLLKKMKRNRGENKDIDDVKLINTLENNNLLIKANYKISLLTKNIKKLHPKNIYTNLRTKAHRYIPINSVVWRVLRKMFYSLKKIK